MSLKRAGRPAWRNSSQASPSSAAESWRELRAPTESARTVMMKRMKIAKTARPRIRPPLPFSKEKAESRPLTTSVPVTTASASPASTSRSTSALRRRAPADDRVDDEGQRQGQADGAEGRQFGREYAC